MKELSIEEKAKRYDEAYKKVAIRFGSNVADEIFPELKESEDNIIIKALKSGFKMLEREYNLKGLGGIKFEKILTWLEKQGEEKPNPYSGTSFEYNGHTWGMCARDNGVEILIDGHLDRVFTIDSNAKEMFIKALERVEEQNAKGYKLTDCDKNSWWEDFKAYTSCTIEQKPVIKMKTQEESLGVNSDTYNKIVDECVYGEQKTVDKVEPKFKIGDWVVHDMSDGKKIIRQIVNMTNKSYILDGECFNTFYFNDLENDYHLWTIADAKDGDVLSYATDEEDLWIMIYRSLYEPYEGHVHYHALLVNNNFSDKGTCFISIDNLKPATKEQRDTLMKAMADAGYTFDFEKKELKEIEPAEWSEECCINQLIVFCENCMVQDSNAKKCASFLKSLKDRYTWKPSDEQMNTLEYYMHTLVCNEHKEILFGLYVDLKKLKE